MPVVSTYYAVDRYLFSISNAEGASMEPTIRSEDIVLIDKFTYRFLRPPQKDDIVVAIQPVSPETSICKRIVGVGGSIVPYGPGIKVSPQHYWLEGDNKNQSYDSRHHGQVPENLILGRILAIIPV